MAFAPFRTNDEILGCFREKTHDNLFEFSTNDAEKPIWKDYPLKVWVSENAYRWAKVLKTVAYIVVDEDAAGMPVVEKWETKKYRIYDK